MMREELARRVEIEFVVAQYPGDQNIGGGEVKHFVGQKEWRKVPLKLLSRNQAAIIGFTPKAYHFYLPAFLCAVLRYPELEHLEHPLVYSLIPPLPPNSVKRTPEQALPLFSKGEKLVIVDFLEKHRELFPISSYTLENGWVTEIQRAIQFWKES